ncbi:MAG: TIGR04076 family protein [Chloroflexota bacterium]|nr:TIGR04076 family protein [Chloroflexota bacterium]
MSPVRITVKKGKCQGNLHQIGEEFLVEDTTPEGVCLGAWNALVPYLTTLGCGGNFSWEDEKGVATIHCPDPKCIILELRRAE